MVMICQQCKKKQATLFANSLNHSEKRYIPLCKSCYGKKSGQKDVSETFNRDNKTISHPSKPFNPHSLSDSKHLPVTTIPPKPRKQTILDRFGKNLNHSALEGRIDPVIGRDLEIQQAIEILNRRMKNNPVFIGEPGVGKTAIAEGLALRIIEGKVPNKLINKEVYALDTASLVSGTSFRGQFEERVKQIIHELEKRNDIILFIDELHLIVGAGAVNGSMDVSNMLKPTLARGAAQIMGATTEKEYRQIEKDAALERRFQPIQVSEPNEEDCFEILKGLRPKYEEYHRVSFSDEILRSCITLSTRYIQDRFLPDKAIDLLDTLGSKTNLKVSENCDTKRLKSYTRFFQTLQDKSIELKQYQHAAYYKQEVAKLKKQSEQLKTTATIDDLIFILETKTGIPIAKLQSNEQQKIKHLHASLSKKIIGQPTAVEKVAQAIKRSKTGLHSKSRPIASFLFSGPTGVGKTELTKVLAEELFGSKEALIRLDMSEYMEKQSVSKLIGSPPGYIGYEEAGQLTEKVRRKPYSILLLDEIEKSHPDVQNIFLQILDDGHLTDSQGRTINFKNTIIIATTNAGATEKKKAAFGFRSSPSEGTSTILQLKEYFKPEFLNRFDDIIMFQHLEQRDLIQIIDLLLEDLRNNLYEQHITLTISEEAKIWISNIGYEPSFGARHLRRAIQEHIENKIADVLLYEQDVSHILVNIISNEINCEKSKKGKFLCS